MNEDGTAADADADEESQDENNPPSPNEAPETPTAPESPTMLNPLCGIDSLCFGDNTSSSKKTKDKQKKSLPTADAFEPDTFKNPPLSQPAAYRRIRSPPVRNRKSLGDDDRDEDYRPRHRSRSPMSRRRPSMSSQSDSGGSHYQDDELSARRSPSNSKRKWYKPWKRPSTPYRRRQSEVGPYDDEDAQFSRGRSRSPSRGRMDGDEDEDEYYRGRRASRSPSRGRSVSQERRYVEDRGRSRDRDYDDDRLPRSASSQRRYEEDRGRSNYEDRMARSASQERRYVQERGRSRDRDLDYEDRVARSASQERRYMEGRGRSRERDLDYEDRVPRSASVQRRYDEGRSRDYDDRRSREFDVDRRRSRDTGDNIDRGRARDLETRPAPKTKEEERPRGRRPPQLNTDREVQMEDIAAMSPRTQREWKQTKDGGWIKEEEAADDDRAQPKPSRPAEVGDERANSRAAANSRSRRVSDPVRPARLQETDGPDYNDPDHRRPHTTASHQSRRGAPLPINTSSDQEDAVPNRDPTPRMSMEPTTIYEEKENQGPLPPTPRRRQEDRRGGRRQEAEDEYERPVRSRSSRKHEIDDEVDEQREMPNQRRDLNIPDLNVQTFRPPEETAQERKSRRALAHALSPKSISTEDEIREEVSSVGMESSTLRPSFLNPFLAIPPPIIEDHDDAQADSDPSELTSLELKPSHSSNGSAPSRRGRRSEKKESRDRVRSHDPYRSERDEYERERESRDRTSRYPTKEERAAKEGGGSSSSSKKKKGIWKGFAKKIGMVKAIAKEIDAQRNNMPLTPGGGIMGPMTPKKVPE
jgi:hypothetical protein